MIDIFKPWIPHKYNVESYLENSDFTLFCKFRDIMWSTTPVSSCFRPWSAIKFNHNKFITLKRYTVLPWHNSCFAEVGISSDDFCLKLADTIKERMAVSSDDAWDVGGPTPPPGPGNKFPKQEPQFTLDGLWDVSDVVGLPSRSSRRNMAWNS